MEIGDSVVFTGTVRDIKDGSVLTAADDGREYWFLEQHVALAPTAAQELTAATKAVEQAESSDPNYQAAVDHVVSKGYTAYQAKAIIAQIGVAAALAA